MGKTPKKGGGGSKTQATKSKVVSKAAPASGKHLPVLEGFCLARGNRTKRVVCGVSGVLLPHCWRGGKCKGGSCEKCLLCPVCQCECDFIPRSRKRKYFTDDGGKALSRGARKKEVKPVSNVTPSVSGIGDGRPPPRRNASIVASQKVRKMQRDDHVELSLFGSHEKGPALEYAMDKAHLMGGEVLDKTFSRAVKVAMDGDYEDDPECLSPVKVITEEVHESRATINSMRAEMNVRTTVTEIKGSWETATHDQRVRSHRFVKEIVQECCARICPDDVSTMMNDVLRDLEPPPSEQRLLQTVGSMQARLPKSSVQRAVLVAAMCSSQTRTAAQKYITPLGSDLFERARDDASCQATAK